MDRAGRIVIPPATRARYGLLDATHALELEESADGIGLRPSSGAVPAGRDASGGVVFRSGDEEVIDPVAAVREARERRHRSISGEGGTPASRPR